jgi:hypothetical protein
MEPRDDNSQWQFEQETEQQFEEDFQKFVASHEEDFKTWEVDYLNNHADSVEQQCLYAEYIMEHCGGDRIICNGDTLIAAQEDGYLWDAFLSKQYEDYKNEVKNEQS